MPTFTDLKNPDFGKVAEAMGLWGRTVTKAPELEHAIQEWLAQPGPALLNVKVAPQQLVMPPRSSLNPLPAWRSIPRALFCMAAAATCGK